MALLGCSCHRGSDSLYELEKQKAGKAVLRQKPLTAPRLFRPGTP